jgi:ABC-type glutathione transport system ATPase component
MSTSDKMHNARPSASPVNESNHNSEGSCNLFAENIIQEYYLRKTIFRTPSKTCVLDGFTLNQSERKIIGLVGDSGAGKTTFAKIFAGLLKPTSGQVYLNGQPIYSMNGQGYKLARKSIRFIFQNVNAPLNPRMSIRMILEEPLEVHSDLTRFEWKIRITNVAEEVGLPLRLLEKYPAALSGGEKRRVALARALMNRPLFIIADEPTAGLDTDLRRGLLTLLQKLRDVEGIGILVISHDMNAIATICDEVIVLNKGKRQ